MKAILIVGHGSSLETDESAVQLHARLLKSKGYENIYCGYKGYSEPSIDDAVKSIVDSGFDEIIAVPLFISMGHYMNNIIPKKLGLDAGASEGSIQINNRTVNIIITEAFGHHPDFKHAIISIIENVPCRNERKGILLIGHGSKEPYNSEMVEFNAQNLRDMGFSDVYTAYNEFNEPSVEDTISRMIREGVKECVAVPMFVSPGIHTIKDLPEKLGIIGNKGFVQTDDGVLNVNYSEPAGMSTAVNEVIELIIRRLL